MSSQDDEAPRETAVVVLRRVVNLETADRFVGGWQEPVMVELSRMRALMPYADRLFLELRAERPVE